MIRFIAEALNIFNGVDVTGTDGPKQLIQNLLTLAFWAVGALSVIFLFVAGILYALSFGQPDRLRQAKSAITWAIGGLVVAMSAYAIVTLIFNGFN